MEGLKLAFEVLASWIMIGSFIGLTATGFYLFIELWKNDRKALCTLIVVFVAGMVTGISIAMIQ